MGRLGFFAQESGYRGPPVFVEAVPSVFNTAAATHTPNLPADREAGDLLVAMFSVNLHPSSATSFSAGWDEVHKAGGNSQTHWTVKRVATGDADDDLVFTLAVSRRTATIIYRFKKGTFHGDVASASVYASALNPATTLPSVLGEPPWGFSPWNLFISSASIARNGGPITDLSYPDGQVALKTLDANAPNVGTSLAASYAVIASDSLRPPNQTANASGANVRATIMVRPLGSTGLKVIAQSILNKLRHWYDVSGVDADDQIKDEHNGAHLDMLLATSGTQLFPSIVAAPNGDGLSFPFPGGTERNVWFVNDDGLGEDFDGDEYSFICYNKQNGTPNTTASLLKLGATASDAAGIIQLQGNAVAGGNYRLRRTVGTTSSDLSGSATNVAAGNEDWRMTYGSRRWGSDADFIMVHDFSDVTSSQLADAGPDASFLQVARGVVFYGEQSGSDRGSGGSFSVCGIAIFNGRLTGPERMLLYNAGNFRKYADIIDLATS